MELNKINIAIVGFGNIGSYFYKVLEKNKKAISIKTGKMPFVKYITAKNINKKRKIKIPKSKWIKNFKTLVCMDDIDIVVGTLPHWLHRQAAIDCLGAGKHVFLEKPMALNATEADDMILAAKASGKLLMIAHTQRYFGENVKMKEIIDSGDLGEVVMVNAMWVKPLVPDSRPEWMLDGSRGGGMGQMDGTHLIDRLIWLLGDDIYSVSGTTSNYTHPHLNSDDSGQHFLRWKSGVTACCWSSSPPLSSWVCSSRARHAGPRPADHFLVDRRVELRPDLVWRYRRHSPRDGSHQSAGWDERVRGQEHR